MLQFPTLADSAAVDQAQRQRALKNYLVLQFHLDAKPLHLGAAAVVAAHLDDVGAVLRHPVRQGERAIRGKRQFRVPNVDDRFGLDRHRPLGIREAGGQLFRNGLGHNKAVVNVDGNETLRWNAFPGNGDPHLLRHLLSVLGLLDGQRLLRPQRLEAAAAVIARPLRDPPADGEDLVLRQSRLPLRHTRSHAALHALDEQAVGGTAGRNSLALAAAQHHVVEGVQPQAAAVADTVAGGAASLENR